MGKSPYKMKGSPMARNFGIGASPMKSNETTRAEKKANLLKAVPNKEAYDKLSATDKKGFDEAGKKAGLPQKKSPTKILGLTALATAALIKAAVGGAVSAGIGKGVGAISKAKAKKKAAKADAQNKAKEASAKSTDMGEIGTKTNITEEE